MTHLREHPVTAPEGARSADLGGAGELRVLLVEDDRMLTRRLLKTLRRASWRCSWTDNGHEAVELLRRERFEVAVVDWGLPGLDGPTVCELKRAERIDTAVIMITGWTDHEHIERAIRAGACDFLSKPFEMERLLERMRVVTARRAWEDVTEVGHIRIVRSKRAVWAEGLRAREVRGMLYELLLYLAQVTGRLVSRERLARDVWQLRRDGSNTVVVHISQLRKWLPPAASAQILTVGGSYALVSKPGIAPSVLAPLD